MGPRASEEWCLGMSETPVGELSFAIYFSRTDDRIHVQLERDSFGIADAVYLRHQLDRAIRDYEKAAGR